MFITKKISNESYNHKACDISKSSDPGFLLEILRIFLENLFSEEFWTPATMVSRFAFNFWSKKHSTNITLKILQLKILFILNDKQVFHLSVVSPTLWALHYPLNWILFLEINKLYNVITEDWSFSTNRNLISINGKVWTSLNFSTNWHWKWMNRIWHGKKNVVGK